MTDQLDHARAALNALTPAELATIRDDASRLLNYHETTGGVLMGGGYLETKEIPFPVKTTDEDGNITVEKRIGHYCYVRRAQIDGRGAVTTKTVGYYGRGGVQAMADGRGDELLAAHIAGGEDGGDSWLSDNGYDIPARRLRNNPPAARPVHPLNDESVTSAALENSVVFGHFLASCPVPARDLLAEIRQYERDLDHYNRANEAGHRFRLPPDQIDQRRAASKRKADTGKRTVRRRRGDRSG